MGKQSRRRLILFELNEVPWKIVNFYCRQYPDSTLATLLPRCHKYETVTPDEGHLSPWITWPTFHRGVANTRHRIQDFNQDLSTVNAEYPPVWELLQREGVKTGVFGSLHSSPVPKNYRDYAFFVPDPFSPTTTAHPEYVESFQKFNLAMSRESSRNVSSSINVTAGASVLAKWPRLGFTGRTCLRIGRHLIEERRRPWLKTRRRTYQVVLAFDVFMRQLKRTQPLFGTFFSNHVASTMHRYWAASFPEDYATFQFDEQWVERYRNEIAFTMRVFDTFLRELVAFADAHPAYKIMVASSMGQASTDAQPTSSQTYVKDANVFLARLGLVPEDCEHVPAMFPQYNVRVRSEKVASFRAALSTLVIDNQRLSFREADNGFFALDFGHQNVIDQTATLDGRRVPFAALGLFNMAIEDRANTNAYHVPEGTLFIYDPQDRAPKDTIEQIRSTVVAPNILNGFHVNVPSYMTCDAFAW